MRLFLSLLYLGLLVGCSESSPISPRVPFAPALGSRELPQVVQVGEEVTVGISELRDGGYYLTLTPPSDGTLLARIAWQRPDDLLQMMVGETLFAADSVARLPDGRLSVVGSASVTGGRLYRIWVANVPGPWDDSSWIASSFMLTTSMQ